MKITRKVEIEFTRRVTRRFSTGNVDDASNFDREDKPLDEIVRNVLDRAVADRDPDSKDPGSKEK